MKKIIISIVILLAISLPSFALPNSPDGFRGMKWGDSPTLLGKRKSVEGYTPHLQIYTNSS